MFEFCLITLGFRYNRSLMLRLLLLFLFLFSGLSGFSQVEVITPDARKVLLYENRTWKYAEEKISPVTLSNPELPAFKSGDQVIHHSGYSLLYNETYEQASWVAYELTRGETGKLYERTDRFIPDPKVRTGSATDSDYIGSGYDRGHLAPAADMGWSSAAMSESFYFSNMSPQSPSFNRGIWKRLEELVRTWAVEYESIYIATGPVLRPGLKSIGANHVAVPEYYYKVILDYKAPGIRGIGFIIPNAGSDLSLKRFAVSIDSVERFTGIDFFPSLPDDQESLIEKDLCTECWIWKSFSGGSGGGGESSSGTVQCSGVTKAGTRCNNKTSNQSGYCYLHENSAGHNTSIGTQSTDPAEERRSVSVQCLGTTQAGNRCKRMTYSGNGYCFQHGGR